MISVSGRLVYWPEDGLGDAIAYDVNGAQGRVPAGRFLMMTDSNNTLVRAILPIENYRVNLFNAYFGNLTMQKVYPDSKGRIVVFKVG